MTLRVMYDSANMDAIPADAQVVAGYPHRGGDTVWNPARFPHALVMAIDQRGDHADDCHAADYEQFAIFGTALIRQWVESWHLLHPRGMAAQNGFFLRPPVYSDLTNLPSVISALHGLTWDPWVAAWPGNGPVLEPGWAAHQYADPKTSGGDFDLTVISAGFGARPVPPPPPVDEPPGWQDRALAEAALIASSATALTRLIGANTP